MKKSMHKYLKLVNLVSILACVLTFSGCGNLGINRTLTANTSVSAATTTTTTATSLTRMDLFAGRSFAGASYSDGVGASAQFKSPEGITNDGTFLYVSDTDNHTIRKVDPATGVVTTIAGSPGASGAADGTGSAARFSQPRGICNDGLNLYVADSNNTSIRKIVISTGVVTTFAGLLQTSGSSDGIGPAARFSSPTGITCSGGNLYVVDTGGQTVRKVVIATAAVSTIAGSYGVMGTANGVGAAASFFFPQSVATDGTWLYVSEISHTIRKIEISTGTVSTYAGAAWWGSTEDGIGTSAHFSGPTGLTLNGSDLYVSDAFNNRIRKIDTTTATVTTIAGHRSSSFIDGAGLNAWFSRPSATSLLGGVLYLVDMENGLIRAMDTTSLAVTTIAGVPPQNLRAYLDSASPFSARFNSLSGVTRDGNDVYLVDTGNYVIRKLSLTTGAVTTFAGTAGTPGGTDGPALTAKFEYPSGIFSDGTNLYVADQFSIRKIVIATGVVSTLAGLAGTSGAADGVGGAARFYNPTAMVGDGTNLFVVDYFNSSIRKIVIATGAVTTIAGGVNGSADGIGVAAQFSYPRGIATDGTNLYIADSSNHTIRKMVIATGAVTTFAGTAGISGSLDGIGAAAQFYNPSDITSDGTDLYVTESNTSIVRRINPATAAVTTIAGAPNYSLISDGIGGAARFNSPQGIYASGGTLFVTDSFSLRSISTATMAVTTIAGYRGVEAGAQDGAALSAGFYSVNAIVSDLTSLYLVDSDNSLIREVDLASGVVTTLAGKNGVFGSVDGVGTSAEFNYPTGLARVGNHLYIVDSSNCTIRDLLISSGAVTTLAGTAGNCVGADGIGAAAGFNYPWGITSDGSNLYVSDQSDGTIRKIVISSGVVTTLAGTSGMSGSADGIGPAARFSYPAGITVDATGLNLYVSDSGYTLRKIVISTGVVTTVAGQLGSSSWLDGLGTAGRVSVANQLSLRGSNILVPDIYNHALREFDTSTGALTTIAGSPTVPNDVDGLISSPAGIYLPNAAVEVPAYGIFVTNRYGIRWIH